MIWDGDGGREGGRGSAWLERWQGGIEEADCVRVKC